MQIDVIFRFIGCFSVPVAPTILTEKQLQEEARRAKERERNHQKYLRKRNKTRSYPMIKRRLNNGGIPCLI